MEDVLLEVVGAAEAKLLTDLGVDHSASTSSLVKDPETPTNWNQEERVRKCGDHLAQISYFSNSKLRMRFFETFPAVPFD